MRKSTIALVSLLLFSTAGAHAREVPGSAARGDASAPIAGLDAHVEAVRQRFDVPGIAVAVI
jgi:hypothetical protein